MLDKLFNQYIGRTVAFVVTPVMAVVSPVVVQFVNNVTGAGLDVQTLTGATVAVVVGLSAVAYKWLSNLGNHERLERELEKLYEAGLELTENPVPSGTVNKPVA